MTTSHGVASSNAAPAGVATALSNLAYAVAQPLRHRILRTRIVDELASLDHRVLSDIGLSRWEIGIYARCEAELRWPARQTSWQALTGVVSAVRQAMRRARSHRGTIHDLMALDDRMLKDIGL